MADTFSFDVVSDFDRQELVNVVDQSLREINTRYDLKDSKTEIDLEEKSSPSTPTASITSPPSKTSSNPKLSSAAYPSKSSSSVKPSPPPVAATAR